MLDGLAELVEGAAYHILVADLFHFLLPEFLCVALNAYFFIIFYLLIRWLC